MNHTDEQEFSFEILSHLQLEIIVSIGISNKTQERHIKCQIENRVMYMYGKLFSTIIEFNMKDLLEYFEMNGYNSTKLLRYYIDYDKNMNKIMENKEFIFSQDYSFEVNHRKDQIISIEFPNNCSILPKILFWYCDEENELNKKILQKNHQDFEFQ